MAFRCHDRAYIFDVRWHSFFSTFFLAFSVLDRKAGLDSNKYLLDFGKRLLNLGKDLLRSTKPSH